ncbi:MAG TPA: PilZ domain-containing protein [Blastocatellia bacterium]|nr:PilZ domain-containing protein [Blastocatellia bacterium]
MSAVGVCPGTNSERVLQQFLRARCEVNGSGRDCRILELTPRGAFIESYVPAVTGSDVSLQFRLPNGHHVSARGVVSYHKFTEGFGVDFNRLSSADREQISSLVG